MGFSAEAATSGRGAKADFQAISSAKATVLTKGRAIRYRATNLMKGAPNIPELKKNGRVTR